MTDPFSVRAPFVSIVVPIYNAGQYLSQCLESILNQSYCNFEVLCLNDGSTDDSLSTMHIFAERDERFVVIDKENQGYGATCNRGIKEARGEYIAIVEPDEWIERDMLQSMIDFAVQFDERVDIIKTPYWRICMPDSDKENKVNCGYYAQINPKKQPFAIEDAPLLLRYHPSIWSALYRKGFLESCDIAFREYPGAGWADNPFLVETLCQAKSIVYLDKPFYCYREETPEKTDSFSHANTLLPFKRWNEMMDILESLKVSDRGVLRAHIGRGFVYLKMVQNASADISQQDVHTEICRMFSRMDKDLVLNDPEISPQNRIFFSETLGLPTPKINYPAYYAQLVRRAIYTLKSTNFKNTIYTTLRFFNKHRERD